jgi:septal ring factor EnvC (AmiA/AmiB activator)
MRIIIPLILIYIGGMLSGFVICERYEKKELTQSQIEIHLEKINQEITLNSKTLSNLSAEYQQLDRRIRGIAAECGKIAYKCKGEK